MDCLADIKYHVNAIKHYYDYAGSGGYSRALDHLHKFSEMYASIRNSTVSKSDLNLLEKTYESIQSMIGKLKEREENLDSNLRQKWMYL